MQGRDSRVVEELGRVLASDAFASAPVLSAFLRFVVEETLAGRADRLKAYTIAVGALDRPDDFDPNDNPLIRVQARRLRQTLERYYHHEGAGSELVIEMPLGTYVPVFRERPAAERTAAAALLSEAASPPRAAAPERRRLDRRLAAAALLIVAAAALAAAAWQVRDRLPAAPPATLADRGDIPADPADRDAGAMVGLDATRVLPLLSVTIDVREPYPPDFDPDIYRNRIESFARRFDDTVVITRRSPAYPPPHGQPLYDLRFLVAREGASTNAYVRLMHVGDERVVRSTAIVLDEALKRPPGGAVTPADLAIVRDHVQLHGAITQDLAVVPDLAPELACLTRAWAYDRDSSRDSHRAARDCLVPLVTANPRLVPALTMLGTVYLGEFRQNFERIPGDPLQRAEEILKRATRLAPSSSAPFQMLESLLLLRGDAEAAVLAGNRAVQANPEDMNAVATHGSVLARIGRYQDAVYLLTRAEAETATPPKWMQFYAFLALNNLGRTREADERVAFFDGSNSSLYLTAAAIRAHRRGDVAAAAAAVSGIMRLEPGFREDPRDFLRRRGLADPVIDRLMVDLTAAGLYRSRT